jgi:50S ribosomal protein L16 3-hydroxylase
VARVRAIECGVGARSRPGSNRRFRSSGSERARARSNGYTRPVITDWLGTISLAEFATTYRGRAPIAQPSTASAACSLLDWDVLDRVLRAVPDALVVARGALLNMPPPSTVEQLRVYFAAGIGLCIRHAERHDPGLASVAAAFEELGHAHVQLFITPGGTHGFGWHYDDEDVFVAQTTGNKDYYFRPNTVAAHEAARPAMFARFAGESSVLCTATLLAGDFLYLPSRWWHMAVCHQDALSISVGVSRR